MKAIARSHWPVALTLAAAALTLLGSCTASPPPQPINAPEPVPVRPAPRPAPLPPVADWRDIMPPAGNWRWGMVQGRSNAQYVATSGAVLASLTCDRGGGQVLLARPGRADSQVAMGITTTSGGNRPLLSNPAAASAGWIVATLPARDRLLDAMAFSRGRFLFDVAGLPPLALPSWPEVSRVIEDCR